MSDPAAWRPEQYQLFGAERSWPFYDLIALLRALLVWAAEGGQ